MLRCQIKSETSEKAGIVLGGRDVFYHGTGRTRGVDGGAFIARVIAAREKKSNLVPERPIKLRLSDFPLQRWPYTRECVASIQCGIPEQEREVAVIVSAGTLLGYHFHAPSSGPSKLRRARPLVHINSPDARQRHLQRAGLHTVNDDLRPEGASSGRVQENGRHRQRITFFGRQIFKPIAIQLDDVDVL